jgi:hypothetical protein
MAKIEDEYYVNLKGKRHPTYPGVLIALHENGLLGIEVNVLQYPSQENGQTAVCQATVTMKGGDGRELIYTEIGDASPANVGHHIAPHIIRMAATRAKGRAGRDALALGVALVEEMGPDLDEQPRHNGQQARQEARTAPQQRARHDPQDNAGRAACAVCGEIVPAAVANGALKEFSETLCIAHARERRQRRIDADRAAAESPLAEAEA